MTKAVATPDSAMVVHEPTQAVEWNLDNWPITEYNRLIPTQTIRMPSDLMAPVVQIVSLDPADSQGKSADHYSSPDVPAGHRAPTARGLNKLSTAAGVSFRDERRVDDGSDPDVIGVTVLASMMLPTGERITAPGTKWVNLNHQSWASDRQRIKYRSFFYEHVSTRARNRAIRALLSLKASYPEAEIRKPFAVVSYAPNMQQPEVRERMLDAIAPRPVAALYGPAADQKQLAAGAPVQELREIEPDEDDQPPAANLQNRPLSDPLGGDRIDGGDLFDSPSAPKPLSTVLHDSADASGLVGGQTQPQKDRLNAILRPLGRDLVVAGFKVAFGVELADITAAQAQAVIAAAGDDDFKARWEAMAAAS